MKHPLWLVGVLLLIGMTAHGREHSFNKVVIPHVLQQELRDAGFKVNYIMCSDTACRIVMPDDEKKNPAALIAAHKNVDPRIEKLKAVRDRLKKGESVPQQDKDEALLFLLDAFLGRKDGEKEK